MKHKQQDRLFFYSPQTIRSIDRNSNLSSLSLRMGFTLPKFSRPSSQASPVSSLERYGPPDSNSAKESVSNKLEGFPHPALKCLMLSTACGRSLDDLVRLDT